MPSRGYPVYSIVKEPCRVTRAGPTSSNQPAALADSSGREQVENTGLEPVTSGLQSRRSPN